MKGGLAGALVALALTAATATAQSVEEVIAAVEGAQPGAEPGSLGALTVDELLEELGVPGLSIAVIRDFEIHWAKGYGVRDVETGAPVNPRTIFQAASISKPVAAMGSLKAVQDGLFGLDQDINTVLTSWQLDGEGFTDRLAVTPRMLMSHTSGLGDAFGYPGYDPGRPLPTAVQTLFGQSLSNTRPIFMEREPMAAYEYSGGGVTLQQVALTDARGRGFAEVLWTDVLAPLEMRDSFFSQPMPLPREENAAAAHDASGQRKGEARWHLYPEQAAAGLWTTPSDLARFLIEVQRAVRGESVRVLDRAHALEMITPVGVGGFGVGFSVWQDGPGWYFGHGGSNWGFRGDIMAHVSKGYGLTQLTNGDRGGQLMAEIQRRIARVYQWDSVAEAPPRGYRAAPELPTVSLPDETMQRYLGRYEIAGDTDVVISREGDGLQFLWEGDDPSGMRPVSETEFRLDGGAQLVFEVVNGRVGGFTLYSGGQQRRFIPAG